MKTLFFEKERVNDEKILILQFELRNCIEQKTIDIWQKN